MWTHVHTYFYVHPVGHKSRICTHVHTVTHAHTCVHMFPWSQPQRVARHQPLGSLRSQDIPIIHRDEWRSEPRPSSMGPQQKLPGLPHGPRSHSNPSRDTRAPHLGPAKTSESALGPSALQTPPLTRHHHRSLLPPGGRSGPGEGEEGASVDSGSGHPHLSLWFLFSKPSFAGRGTLGFYTLPPRCLRHPGKGRSSSSYLRA